ncbi:hypothetical protein EVA_10462 [gut metagenome]|uniref:Uncharacterized protein n=1 Tax=gut metagenome TaxID=749906 RepID=J9G2H7_9ZZZZ
MALVNSRLSFFRLYCRDSTHLLRTCVSHTCGFGNA